MWLEQSQEDSQIQKARNSRAEFCERMFKITPKEIRTVFVPADNAADDIIVVFKGQFTLCNL